MFSGWVLGCRAATNVKHYGYDLAVDTLTLEAEWRNRPRQALFSLLGLWLLLAHLINRQDVVFDE